MTRRNGHGYLIANDLRDSAQYACGGEITLREDPGGGLDPRVRLRPAPARDR